jgi:hypothetical protein
MSGNVKTRLPSVQISAASLRDALSHALSRSQYSVAALSLHRTFHSTSLSRFAGAGMRALMKGPILGFRIPIWSKGEA